MSTDPKEPTGGTTTAWQRFTTFEPALLRGITAALVVILAMFGLDATDVLENVNVAWGLIFALIPLLQAWWTRSKTTASAAVVEQATPTGAVVAGEANELPTGDTIRVLSTPPPGTR